MSEVFVLGVTGKAGSGKDTVCDYLVKTHGFKKIALATPLKEIVEKVYSSFPKEHLYGPSPLRSKPNSAYPLSGDCPTCGRGMRVEDYDTWHCRCGFHHGMNLTPRLALQTLGTEWGRRLYKNTWVDYLFEEVRKSDAALMAQGLPPGRWCISDVRFPNEVFGALAHGGKVVKITRQLHEPRPQRDWTMMNIFKELYGAIRKPKEHASETSLDEIPASHFHAMIENDSTIPALFERVDQIISHLP